MTTVPLMKVHLEIDCVVPHDLAPLIQGQVIEAIAQAVVNGQLSAKMEIELASDEVSLGDVSQAIKEMWLARLAVDVMRLDQAKAQFEDMPIDDFGQTEEPFLIWDVGTSVADIEAWFNQL
jgi:hypothetical protein